MLGEDSSADNDFYFLFFSSSGVEILHVQLSFFLLFLSPWHSTLEYLLEQKYPLKQEFQFKIVFDLIFLLLHVCNCLKAPVFMNGENWNKKNPKTINMQTKERNKNHCTWIPKNSSLIHGVKAVDRNSSSHVLPAAEAERKCVLHLI